MLKSLSWLVATSTRAILHPSAFVSCESNTNAWVGELGLQRVAPGYEPSIWGFSTEHTHKLIPANAHAGASPTIQSTNHLAPKLAAFVTLDFNPRSPSDHNPDGATDAGTFISLLIRRMRCLALAIFIFTYSPKVKRRSQTNPRYLYVTQDSTRLRLNTSETSWPAPILIHLFLKSRGVLLLGGEKTSVNVFKLDLEEGEEEQKLPATCCSAGEFFDRKPTEWCSLAEI